MNIFGFLGRSNTENERVEPVVSEPQETITESKKSHYRPNPFKNCRRSFYGGNVDRMLNGWTSQSHSIDLYLSSELTSLRARARELVRQNPYGKRFITAIKSNIVGPVGVTVQAQSKRMTNGKLELDELANDAIEAAFQDWSDYHADFRGRRSFTDMQNLAISTAGQDGEFIFRVYRGKQYGKYGYQLDVLDPELLDVTKNELTKDGEIRLGVEYDSRGKPIWYHFQERSELGMYSKNRTYKVRAENIIHGFIDEWPDQSRGVPWMHTSLTRLKNLDKYDETAMIASRFGASGMVFLSNNDNGEDFEGDEDDYDGEEDYEDDISTLQNVEAGTIKNIGSHKIQDFDPRYPHELYDPYHKANLRAVTAGLGTSYYSISNDLSDVNFSSIRAGVLEDREVYKGIQGWFIRMLIRPVYQDWLTIAVLKGAILVGKRPLARPVSEYLDAKFQARRWEWVDPVKDANANEKQIKLRIKSRSETMREQGRDPNKTWDEIEREESILIAKGLMQEAMTPAGNNPPENEATQNAESKQQSKKPRPKN